MEKKIGAALGGGILVAVLLTAFVCLLAVCYSVAHAVVSWAF